MDVTIRIKQLNSWQLLTSSSPLKFVAVTLLLELLLVPPPLFRQTPVTMPSLSDVCSESRVVGLDGGIMLSTSRTLLMRLADCGFRSWSLRTFRLCLNDLRVRSCSGLVMHSIQASHSQNRIFTCIDQLWRVNTWQTDWNALRNVYSSNVRVYPPPNEEEHELTGCIIRL